MKAHRNVIAWVMAFGATLLLVTPLAAERLIVRTYSVADGLPSHRIGSTPRSMRVNIPFEARDGALLAGTDGGLFRARHPDVAPQFERVPLAFPGFPDSGLQVWAIVEDAAGRTWVGTPGGLVRLRGTRSPEHIPVALAPNLDHVFDIVRDDYLGFGFGADVPLRFQVRRDGVDDDRGTATSQSSVLYGGLGPGRYRLQVRAESATGRVSAEPATVDFTILPPFWLRAWFLAGLIALLAAALFAAHRLRMRRVLELERVRTRIAADLHDDLGASLARVSLLSEATRRTLPDNPEHAERMLHEIGMTSRELVTAAGDIAFSIDPGRGQLDGLVARLRRFTEDLLADTDIDWRFTVDGEMADVVLSSDQRRHLLAIVKEALHNAVRHARPRHVSLSLALRGDILTAELTDDGCGFQTDVSDDGRAPQAHRNARGRQTTGRNGREPEAGHGLRNMRDRARVLGAYIEIHSHPGGGTRVSLRCPLRSRTRMIMR